ncbi:uncharacterized protein LOC143925464 [Lithobates pipiens]
MNNVMKKKAKTSGIYWYQRKRSDIVVKKVAPKPSPVLRSISPANVMPSITPHTISSSPNDPFHCTSSAKNENTGFLAITPKPSPALRSILPANVMPSITPHTISSSANDPFHCTSSAKNENTGFLAIAPKPSPVLRSILPANVMPSITPHTAVDAIMCFSDATQL